MAEKLKNISKSYIVKGLLGLSFIGAVLCVALYVLSGDTMGWFAMNEEVRGDGAGISAEGLDITVDYRYRKAGGDWTDVAVFDELSSVFSGLCPGEYVELCMTLSNGEAHSLLTDIGFRTIDEKPMAVTHEDGTTGYYYYGSQLCVTWAGETEMPTADNNYAAQFFVPNPDRRVYFDNDQITVPVRTSVIRDLLLPAAVDGTDGMLTVYVTVEFVNFKADQNEYQNYQTESEKDNGACSRLLSIDFVEVGGEAP